ncbi:uncharacterized protein [Littorina saxatilis]|uniref:EF-hand domain-containing protein n=1 Tax=Littorina saxatilis TaxID=31220 RepID=A0AAN9B5X5_9CAEN
MHKSILVALVICAVLIVDSHGWRVRFRGRKIRRYLGEAAKKYVALKVVTAAAAAVGKRAAPCPEPLTPDQMNQIAAELQTTCLGLGVNVGVTGLNPTQLEAIFQDNDANADGVLKDTEISAFSESIQTVEACAAVEGARKK